MSLDPSHPSFGCRSVMFLADLAEEGGQTRLVVVHATNPWAIFLIESLAGEGGRVSEGCRVVGTFRNASHGTVECDRVEPRSFVDFLVDIVPGERLHETAVMAYAMVQSLSPSEKHEMVRRLGEKISARKAREARELSEL